MAFDETFRPKITIDEEEVFSLTGKTRAVRELQPTNFEGLVADWAEERATKFGDTILSRHVYLEKVGRNPHRVAWIYHEGFDLEEDQAFERHHIACDCLLEADREGEPERMFACEALLSVLSKRAWIVSAIYSAEDTARAIPELPQEALFGADRGVVADDFNLRAMSYLLEHDVRHPESWVGNILDGEHMASLMALILQLPPEDIRYYAEIMERGGVVEFDGETIMLTEEEKQRIANDQAFRKIVGSFPDQEAA